MTIGEGREWRCVACGLPLPGSKSNPGEELVAFSRADHIINLALFDTDEAITREQILKIGTTPSYQKRRDFEASLRTQEEESQQWLVERITECDDSQVKTFQGGCDSPMRWFDMFLPVQQN